MLVVGRSSVVLLVAGGVAVVGVGLQHLHTYGAVEY